MNYYLFVNRNIVSVTVEIEIILKENFLDIGQVTAGRLGV